jgi:DNA-binding response OmpR family regulator
MPGISGRELAQRVAVLRPAMRVLYTSGYTDRAVVSNGVLESGLDFIQKPFAPADLTARVRAVLDRNRD